MKKILIGILVVAIIIGAAVGISHKKSLGDATVSNYPTWYYNGIVIGPSNSMLSNIISGSCSVSTGVVNPNASANVTCSVPGAKVGDKVFASSPTGGVTSHSAGFAIVSSGVSSNDAIYLDATNLAASTASMSSTTINYLIFR